MEKENCIMCQKPIGKQENQWALQIRPTIWIHYNCLENLWSSFNATPFQKQLRAERDQLRAENERLRRLLETDVSIQELCYAFHYCLRKADVFDNIHEFIAELDDQKYHDAMKLLLDVRKQIIQALNEVTKC